MDWESVERWQEIGGNSINARIDQFALHFNSLIQDEQIRMSEFFGQVYAML